MLSDTKNTTGNKERKRTMAAGFIGYCSASFVVDTLPRPLVLYENGFRSLQRSKRPSSRDKTDSKVGIRNGQWSFQEQNSSYLQTDELVMK